MKIDNKWREINEAWLKSGLPQKRFCQENNISYFKFVAMRSVLSARPGLPSKAQPEWLQENETLSQNTFIPIKMSDQKQPLGHPRPIIEVQLPYGIILRIPTHE